MRLENQCDTEVTVFNYSIYCSFEQSINIEFDILLSFILNLLLGLLLSDVCQASRKSVRYWGDCMQLLNLL